MTFLESKRSYHVAALLAAVMLCVGLASTAHAAAVSDMLVCVSTTNAGGFGCDEGNSFVIQYGAGSFTTSTSGDGTVATPTPIGSPVDGVGFSGTAGQFTSSGTGLYESPGDVQEYNTVDVASSGAGTVYLVFATDNYTSGNPFSMLAELDFGPGVASVTDTLCYQGGSGSFIFCGGEPASYTIGTDTITSSGALSISGAAKPPGTPFGLQQDIAITFSGAGTFSGDFPVRAAPEPASILLFGVVAFTAFLAIRRKMQLS